MRKVKNSVNKFFQKHLHNTVIYSFLSGAGEYGNFIFEVLRSSKKLKLARLDSFLYVVFKQIKFTGHKAMPLISIISLIIGASTIIQAVIFLPKFGQESYISNMLKLVIVREVGPLITGIIILIRSGSAIATELATQKLHSEIKEIELMGVNTYLFMVLPRIIGGLVATLLLVFYFDFIAFFGGYFIANFVADIPFSSFFSSLLKSISFNDILSSVIKGAVYGVYIPLTCSFFGVKPNALFEIPIYVSKAVVRSLLGVFILNIIISVVFYM